MNEFFNSRAVRRRAGIRSCICAAAAAAAFAAQAKFVQTGGMNEAVYGGETARKIAAEKLGDLNVLFVGPWTEAKIRAVGQLCRKHKMRFTMDEAYDRGTGRLGGKYRDIWPGVKKALAEYSDVLDGSLLMCEYGGVSFNWPLSSVKDTHTEPKSAATFGEAESNCVAILREAVADARKTGLPPPYISIEPTYGTAPFLFRGGIDRVDVEVIYGNDLERRFAGTVGAVRAFGRPGFGADMAMVWYGGGQHDALWESRWRTSLYHAWLRGADPVYAEHGVMDYRGMGKSYDASHPDVKRFRKVLGEFAAWAKKQPRAEGLPLAAVAAIQGRGDGFVGGWQTHLWGQRRNDAWRIGDPERAWEIFDGLYRRRRWEDRYKWGDRDCSGNPPLGQADILPYDADDAKWSGYKTLFFLGRNSMDETLHSKLVNFVRGGGTLLLSACHLDTADRPGESFKPFRGGDWRELTGLKAVPGKETRMPYGIKFTAAPAGWNFTLWGPVCDPWFTDGGFRMPVLENFGATPLALTSEAFGDPRGFDPKAKPVVYSHRIGAGTVVFLASLDSPGGPNVRPLYEHLVARALDATPAWPKVDCSGRVRWAVYPGGRMYFLNTEEFRSEEVIVKMSSGAEPVRFTLPAGGFRELERSEMAVTLSFDDGLKEHLATIAPLLEKRGWRGIFGIVPKWVGKGAARLDWDGCRELMRRGHEVALHGYSHANLDKLTRERRFDEIRSEIRLGIEAMEKNLGVRPKLFVAPYSAVSPEAARIIKDEGLVLLPKARRNFGYDTPAGTPEGVGAYLDGKAAAGADYCDVMVHGIDKKTGAWHAFGDVAAFERHLDEIASRKWVKVVAGDEARKAYPPCRLADMVCADDRKLHRGRYETKLTEAETAALKKAAERIMCYRLKECTTPYHFANHRIDWNFNPTHNGYLEWPWQLARMRFLPKLAEYYARTGDERAASVFADMVSSFIDQMPPPDPSASSSATVAWRTLDTGLRATSLANSYPAFALSPRIGEDFKRRFFAFLEEHAKRILPSRTENNWRVMELRGLLDLALVFPHLPGADGWRKFAEKELEKMLFSQVYPDGFQFELSSDYHTIIDSDYGSIFDNYRALGLEPPAYILKGLELAYELYPRLTRPDRRLPQLNDGDATKIIPRMKRAVKFYPERDDFRWFATDGGEGRAPDYLSYAFPWSGAVVFRDSWSRDAVWGYVDMSPYGRSHQHEDKLNFLLFAYGKEMITDAGNYEYDTSEMRKYVISTRAHNTIMIDGKEQNTAKTWRWHPRMLNEKADYEFKAEAGRETARASFTAGYGKGADYTDKVTHTRTVEFIKNDPAGKPYFRVTDELAASDGKEHSYEQMWHLEKCRLEMGDTSFTADFGDGVRLEAGFTSDNGRLTDMKGMKTPVFQGWKPVWAEGDNEHRPIHTPVLKGKFTGKAKIVGIFKPVKER